MSQHFEKLQWLIDVILSDATLHNRIDELTGIRKTLDKKSAVMTAGVKRKRDDEGFAIGDSKSVERR
jgi:hypothetical protein